MANKLLDFLIGKKREVDIVLESVLPEDDTTTFIGEGTEEEYKKQVIADKGLAGIFGIGGGNNAP